MPTMETDACKGLSASVPYGIEKEIQEVVFIGDIHGRTIWKKIIDLEPDADRYVFFGDYFDPYEPISFEVQAQNFRDLLNLKAQLGERVVLLLGNHDYHYYANVRPYSRYDFRNANTIKSLLTENLQAFRIAFQFGNFLCSHAGVSTRWLDTWFPGGWVWKGIDQKINSLHAEKPEAFDYFEGDRSGYGEDERQGPLWIRPNSLSKAINIQITQVFGHTRKVRIQNDPFSNLKGLFCTDSLEQNFYSKLTNSLIEDSISIGYDTRIDDLS